MNLLKCFCAASQSSVFWTISYTSSIRQMRQTLLIFHRTPEAADRGRGFKVFRRDSHLKQNLRNLDRSEWGVRYLANLELR